MVPAWGDQEHLQADSAPENEQRNNQGGEGKGCINPDCSQTLIFHTLIFHPPLPHFPPQMSLGRDVEGDTQHWILITLRLGE